MSGKIAGKNILYYRNLLGILPVLFLSFLTPMALLDGAMLLGLETGRRGEGRRFTLEFALDGDIVRPDVNHVTGGIAHGAFRFPDLLADPVVQIQRDFTGHALGFHVHRSFAWFFPFRATQAYPKSEEKAITKTNNLSAKAGATNVTSNNGYVGGCFGEFHPSPMRVLRKPSISGGMASSGCCTGWEGTA